MSASVPPPFPQTFEANRSNFWTWQSKKQDQSQVMFTFEKNQVIAGIYRKNAYEDRVEAGRIKVETRSPYDLLRGDPQQSFSMNRLTEEQQRGVLESLSSRNIQIETKLLSPNMLGLTHSLTLTIGALP